MKHRKEFLRTCRFDFFAIQDIDVSRETGAFYEMKHKKQCFT